MNSNLDDWPSRWHRIVSGYNSSYSISQLSLRKSAEGKFDQIRRDNDLRLADTRTSRDECADRVCRLLDSKLDVRSE